VGEAVATGEAPFSGNGQHPVNRIKTNIEASSAACQLLKKKRPLRTNLDDPDNKNSSQSRAQT
jgi:hypothetical protein